MVKFLLILAVGGALANGLARSEPPLLIDSSQTAPAAPLNASN
ncbi:MAG: hypothetical protein ABI770_07725 [Sphingomicrobium sp.]